ncbi:MAG: hypothetical protein V3V01_16540 [Acidimicrobiales bacterium]
MTTIGLFGGRVDAESDVLQILATETFPADLAISMARCDSLVIADGYGFAFDSLPAARDIPLAVCFDGRDTPSEMWAQYREVLPTVLTSGDLVVVPEALAAHLIAQRELSGVPIIVRDGLDAKAMSPGALVARLDQGRAAAEVLLNESFAPVLAAAVGEVPAGMLPTLWCTGESPIRIGLPIPLTVIAGAQQLVESIDIAVVQFALTDSSSEERLRVLRSVWPALRCGGSLVVVDEAGTKFGEIVDSIAIASNRHAVMADMASCEVGAGRLLAVLRVRKLGAPRR